MTVTATRLGQVAYVVKRFPRASETFIAQEILELERQGVAVQVFALRENDCRVEHAWLSEIRAPVTVCDGVPLSIAWKWLHVRAAASPEARAAVEDVLMWSFRHPSRRGRHRLAEAVALAMAVTEAPVHLHAHFANEPAFVALLVHRLLGIPFSFTAHAKDVYDELRSPEPEVWRLQAAEADFVVTVTECNRRFLHGLLGPRLGSKVLRLYNGVDLDRFSAHHEGRPRPKPTGPDSPAVRIVTVARLVAKKGLDVLIDALAALERTGPLVVCRVLGDGPERDALVARARERSVSHRVVFEGLVAHQHVVRALAEADLFVLPARVTAGGDRDALPTVLLEAAAQGLPCVSTPVGGIPEIIRHRETGLLVPSNSPLALAQAIAELAGDAILRARLGAGARSRAKALFDLHQNVATLRGWFEPEGPARVQAAGGVT